MHWPVPGAPKISRNSRIRPLAWLTLSAIRLTSSDFCPDRVRSSTPLPIAPIGLIRSWQIRDATSAVRLRLSIVFIFPGVSS